MAGPAGLPVRRLKAYKIRLPTAPMEKRSMPVCFTAEQHRIVVEFAKRRGMLNASQAIEKILGDA